MKVVQVSTYDIGGGAARAAYRLHSGLRRLGHESYMFVVQRSSDDPSVIAYQPPRDLRSRLRRLVRREQITRSFAKYKRSRPAGYERFSDDRVQHGGAPLQQLPGCDVINLHWIAGLVDYRAFFPHVPKHTPLVWTLHDMNAFTGGCHYDDGCGRFRECCGACPQLGSDKEDDLSRRIWRCKSEVLSTIGGGSLHVVANSDWTATEAQRSSLLRRFPVTTIHCGVDIEDFAPRHRYLARDVLRIPQNASVVLFVADSVGVRRKGFALLSQALRSSGDLKNLFLISVGQRKPSIDFQIPHLHLGYLKDDRWLSLVYSAADIFVIPSLQEAFGQTALESMACGTPVVGFAIGGIPEIVRHGITGLLVPPQDVPALRAAIVHLLENSSQRAEMSANCRRIAVEEFALEIQARRYAELYERLTKQDTFESGREDVYCQS